MNQKTSSAPDQLGMVTTPHSALRRLRQRDILVMIGLVATLLLVLCVTGSLGVIQAITGLIVFSAAAFSYLVGTTTQIPQSSAPPSSNPQPGASVGYRMLTAIPLPAFELDAEERIVAYNKAAGDVLGLRGRPFPRASTVIRAPALLAAIADRSFTGTVDVEGDPNEVWRAHISPIAETARTLIMYEDLTPLRRAAQARADFLANASHELRTPLTAISGFIETLRGPARDDEAAWDRFLGIMATETERMKRLITDLLSLSRIETSSEAPPAEREDLVEIAARTINLLQPMAEAKSLKLVLNAPDGDVPVLTESDEMIQVVENFISNAMKYAAPGGEVRVSIGTSADLSEARVASAAVWEASERMTLLQPVRRAGPQSLAVWLRVEDDGPGIERKHLPRLGERFYRADQSRGGKITGTGLGLAIVKHIMAHHRGGLAVETRLGRGTAFGIWLARAPDTTAA